MTDYGPRKGGLRPSAADPSVPPTPPAAPQSSGTIINDSFGLVYDDATRFIAENLEDAFVGDVALDPAARGKPLLAAEMIKSDFLAVAQPSCDHDALE